ncbi:hypothetical protein CLU79DRAFT_836906 [Phycomyces nitens]|nr:hypothetical protein CLU79DRAFT_836906 [Phycomyces nitens]
MHALSLVPPLPPRPLIIPSEMLGRHNCSIRITCEYHSSGSIEFQVIERSLVPGGIVTLGNIKFCDPEYKDIGFDSNLVDENHAMIWEDDGQLYIRDLDSLNGTYHNGVRLIPSSIAPGGHILKTNDALRLGTTLNGSMEADPDSPSLGSCRICHQFNEPLQALFVPSCAHILHFKCAETLLENYPEFECPTCEKKGLINGYMKMDKKDAVMLLEQASKDN